MIGKPKSIVNNKYAALSDIEQLFDAADDLLNNHLDNLMLRYRDTEPSLYERYQRARTIVDL